MRKPIIQTCEADILMCLRVREPRDCFSSQLARAIKYTHSSTAKAISELLEKQLIEKTVGKRINLIFLTEKGKRVADLLIQLKQELNNA